METRTTFSKRIFSITLSLLMVLSMLLYFPSGTFSNMGFELKASAAEVTLTEPSTDDKGVYQIGTAEELYWFANYVNSGNTSANAVLTADITVNQNVLNENGELNSGNFTSWTPIGNTSNQYNGTFDGKNHTVSGLYFNNSKTSIVGLFGCVGSGGSVFNVGVVDSYFKGYFYLGGVCGDNQGTIENCYNTSKVTGYQAVGGVCGDNQGTIENCYNTGAVSVDTSLVGGVCGWNYNGTITNCYNIGEVSAFGSGTEFGGVCGANRDGTVTNCYYLETSADGGINGADAEGSAESKATAQFTSGEVAYLLSQGENGSVWGQDLSTADFYPVLDSTKKVYRNETYAGCENNKGDVTYSYSNIEKTPIYADHNYPNGICTVCGKYEPAEQNSKGEYEIGNAGQLYWFAELVNSGNNDANAVLTADITVNKNVLNEKGELNSGDFISWTPIGDGFNGYNGAFDGKGFTVSGLYFNVEDTRYVGLFGYVSIGEVSNVGVVDSYFKGKEYVGGVCGFNVIGTIANCYNTSTVSGSNIVGGVCGNSRGTMKNCFSIGTVSGLDDFVGGVCGWESGTITNCYYLANNDDNNGGKTTAQFSSGEVAYLLSQGENGSVWGQDLSTADFYPVLDSTKKVYRNETYAGCENNKGDVTYSYSNTEKNPIYADHDYSNGICTVCGKYEPAEQNSKGEYEIGNAGQLYWFADKVNNDYANYKNANAVLTADITVNKNVLNENGELNSGDFTSWTPIGKNTNISYKGTFDGQNHTISGLYLNNNTTHNAGLFGFMSGGKILNVGIVDSYIHGGDQTGGICGYNASGTITNCYSKGVIKGSNNIGGICGYQSYSKITNCYSTDSVSGTSKVGSICGYAVGGTITNCYYLAETEDENGGKTAAQFGSGEVAYLLSQGEEGYVWGQVLSVSDSYPILDSAYRVYYGYENCDESKEKIYSNTALTDPRPDHNYPNGICTVCGKYEPAEQNSKGEYEIGNAGQLYWFADKVNNDYANYKNANAVLTADITVNKNVLNENGELNSGSFTSWTPIGNWDAQYTGIFDGRNHTVSGLYFNNSSIGYVGLFGSLAENGEIRNIGVIDSYLSGDHRISGVCGENSGTITNCYNTGRISGEHRISGVCGENMGTITNCYNTGTISGEHRISGVCGSNFKGEITNCYNTGTVSGSYFVGGLCHNSGGTITNCYYIDTTTSDSNAVSKTEKQFASGEVAYLLSQGENGSVWGQTIGTENYPVLGGATVYYAESLSYHNHTGNFCEVCDALEPNSEGKYEIANAGQLYWFAELVNSGNTSANAVLTADITVNKNVLNENGELNSGDFTSWTPIGNSYNNRYLGTFDGHNHTISGLYFNDESQSYVGLFYYIGRDGEISNVGVVDSYFKGNECVGAICGENFGTITNCYNTGTVSGSKNVGGVCGECFVSTMTNCYNTGSVSGSDKVGGVCGFDNSGTITNCYYLADTADENGGKTETQFASGEVAYLLSQGTDGSVWGQTIGTENYPVLGGKKVLANVDLSAFANDIIIYGQNAALDGTIGFNIYVSADDSYEWDKTIGGVTGVKNEEGLYVFTYNVAAKDMDNEIQFTVSDKIDVAVSVSGYLADLSKTDNESLKNLADSMSDYGSAAEAYFGDGTVAEQTVTEDLSVYDFTVGTMPEGISYYGSSLILQSETTIRHYFTLAEGKNISDFTFMVDGAEVTLVESKNNPGYYCIEIQNISAEKLGTAFTVSINGEDVITNYSALSYANKVLGSDETDANLKNLVKALYIYNQNALAYNNNAA